jgi:hypothetical protein
MVAMATQTKAMNASARWTAPLPLNRLAFEVVGEEGEQSRADGPNGEQDEAAPDAGAGPGRLDGAGYPGYRRSDAAAPRPLRRGRLLLAGSGRCWELPGRPHGRSPTASCSGATPQPSVTRATPGS